MPIFEEEIRRLVRENRLESALTLFLDELGRYRKMKEGGVAGEINELSNQLILHSAQLKELKMQSQLSMEEKHTLQIRKANIINALLSTVNDLPRYPGFVRFLQEKEEAEAWEAARSQQTLDAYHQYLRQYPAGKHVAEATEAVRTINEQKEKEERSKEETEAWDQARAAQTIPAIEAYLSGYPNGRFVTQAQESLERLRSEQIRKEDRAREEEAWKRARAAHSVEAYRTYLEAFATGRHTEAARKAIGKLEHKQTRAARSRPSSAANKPLRLAGLLAVGIAVIGLGFYLYRTYASPSPDPDPDINRLSQAPLSVDAALSDGIRAFREGLPDRADSLFTFVLSVDPGNRTAVDYLDSLQPSELAVAMEEEPEAPPEETDQPTSPPPADRPSRGNTEPTGTDNNRRAAFDRAMSSGERKLANRQCLAAIDDFSRARAMGFERNRVDRQLEEAVQCVVSEVEQLRGNINQWTNNGDCDQAKIAIDKCLSLIDQIKQKNGGWQPRIQFLDKNQENILSADYRAELQERYETLCP